MTDISFFESLCDNQGACVTFNGCGRVAFNNYTPIQRNHAFNRIKNKRVRIRNNKLATLLRTLGTVGIMSGAMFLGGQGYNHAKHYFQGAPGTVVESPYETTQAPFPVRALTGIGGGLAAWKLLSSRKKKNEKQNNTNRSVYGTSPELDAARKR